MIRLGVVGPGLIWHKVHRPIIAAMPDRYTVTAFSSRTEGRRITARLDFPQAKLYPDYHDLCADPDVDAVVVLTPISLNAVVAEAALASGKVAVVEKPLAGSRKQLRRLTDAVGSKTERLFILEQAVHSPIIAEIKVRIEEGVIGEIVQFERSKCVTIGPPGTDETGGFGDTSWREAPDFPIGMIFDGGIHDLAQLQWLFGPPETVAARGTSLREGYGPYDLVNLSLRYRSGVHGVFTHASALPGIADRFTVRGREGAFVVEDGTLTRVDGKGRQRSIDLDDQSEYESMWVEIADCIEAGTPAGYDLAAATRDLNLLFAVEHALDSGCTEPAG